MQNPLRRPILIGLAIAALALGLRARGTDWGLPDVYEEAKSVEKAWGFWEWDREGLDLNPRFFNYPSLYFYMQFGAQALLRAGGEITGRLPDEAAFRAAYYARPGLFILAGRWLTALLGALTVFVVFLAGRRLGGLPVAVPAALFLAFHSMHVHKSRFVEVDVAMTFFVAAALYAFARYVKGGGARDLLVAGALVGLAASTKYPAIFCLVLLPWAALRRDGPFRPALILGAAVLAVAAFVIASPYALLDPATFLRDLAAEGLHMRGGHFGGAGEGVRGALRAFAGGFGWPLFAAAVAGLGVAAFRPRRGDELLWPMPVVFFALLAASRMQAPHYPLPAVPFLCLAAAVFLARIAGGAGARRAVVLIAGTAALLVVPAGDFAREQRAFAAGDTRTRARVWLEERVPTGTLVLLEPHGPQLFSSTDRRRYAESAEFSPIRGALESALAGRPWYHTAVLPSFSIDVDRSERFYRFPPYQWFEYVVVSDAIAGRYREDPDRFPVQNGFYDEMEARYVLVARFAPGAGTGPLLRVFHRADAGTPLPVALDPTGYHDQDFPAFFRSVAGLYRDRGLIGPAIDLYSALLAIRPDDGETLFQMGMTRALAGNPGRGIEYLEMAVRVDPENRQARMSLAVLLCQTGKLEEGIDIFRKMLAEKEEADLHVNLGSALLQVGRPGEAIPHLRRFLEMVPDHARAADVKALLEEVERDLGRSG